MAETTTTTTGGAETPKATKPAAEYTELIDGSRLYHSHPGSRYTLSGQYVDRDGNPIETDAHGKPKTKH